MSRTDDAILPVFGSQSYVYAQTNTKHPHDVDDNLRNHAANRLINMTYELVIEAKLLQRQMQPVQDFYQGQITYEIGYVMGKIRERYRRMIEIYKQAHYMTKHLYLDENNITRLNTTLALKPGIKMYYPINWVINMEYMRLFEVDIDKLIEVLESIPPYALVSLDTDSTNTGLKAPAPVPAEVPPEGGGTPGGKLPIIPVIDVPANAGGPPIKGGSPKGGPGRSISRTGGGRDYPPDGEGFLRGGLLNMPNEPPPSVPYQSPPSEPNEPPPSAPNEPPPGPPSLTYEPPLGQSNEPPPGPTSQSYQSAPSEPNEPPPSAPNEPPPGPPSLPYEPPLGQSYEPSPGQTYEPSPGQPYELSPGQPYEPSPGQPYEPSPGQPYGPSPGQPYEPSPGQPYEPSPGQPYEPQPGPPSWPTEPPAGPYGKVMRFGSAGTNYRTEEELKQYYREMYREKHNGMNDKYDNLY